MERHFMLTGIWDEIAIDISVKKQYNEKKYGFRHP